MFYPSQGDIRELDEDQATTAYGALVDVPGCCDMLVAGTSCVDYSNLNNEQKEITEQGESGQTFRGMMTWVQRKQPPIVILENVCGAPWEDIAEAFQAKGYAAHFMRVDTKRFYIPHTRTRVYLFATKIAPVKGEKAPKPGEDYTCAVYRKRVRTLSGYKDKKTKKNHEGTLTKQWKDKVKELERPASSTLEAFLFDSDDPRVHKGRQMLARPGEDGTRAGTDWARCESRHQRARLEEGLGARRPFTNWEGGCVMPDYAWNDWGKAQTDRVLDLMDIDFLRLAQADTDSAHKTLVWNLSQNVDRTTGSGAAGICPCLTPSMVPFVTNRGGPLVGIEALSLQGIPVDDLLLARPGEDGTRAGTDWARCESRHQRARLEEGLGARRPFTNWEGGCVMPDYAWNDWGKAQTDRVLDLMDIDFLRLAQADTDSAHKTLVWNLSQNVDRTTGSGAAGICPCLTPSMVPFVTNRGGPLVGIEALSLQGIPVDDLLLTRESEGQMSDLAGNAMTTTVVGACMLSALLLVKDTIFAYGAVVKQGAADEAAKKKSTAGSSMGKSATSLSVGGAAGATATESKVQGVADLVPGDLTLCSVVPKGDQKGYQVRVGPFPNPGHTVYRPYVTV